MRIGRFAALSDTGRRRFNNEDSYVCEPPLFAIADGVGGAQAGEVASRLAAAALGERPASSQGEDTLVALVSEANRRIYERSTTDPEAAGMGTTVTALLVDETAGTIALAHVGDSRAYVFREGELIQLTDDHSLVGELVRSGRLSPEDAEQHPHRSVITRVVGTESTVDVDVETMVAVPGDIYVICSDGLTDMLPDALVATAVADAHDGDPNAVAAALVAAANQAGGIDNITVIVFEIEDGDPQPVAAEPDETTAESIDVAPADSAVAVRRHGAGSGGRALAIAAIVLALAAGALLLWWGIAR